MNNLLSTSVSHFDDDAFFLFYTSDMEEEINRKLSFGLGEYVFVF